MNEGFVLVHMHIESEKDNLVESRQKSGRQKWLSCTVVGISSVASAVLAGVVSHAILYQMSYLDFLRTSIAALFWTLCKREICFKGNPAGMELQ